MKASELIEALQKLIEVHGDREVWIIGYDGYSTVQAATLITPQLTGYQLTELQGTFFVS